MKKSKRILVANGDHQALRRIFNVSYPTVRAALAFKTNSRLAIKIRTAAMERGGVLVREDETRSI